MTSGQAQPIKTQLPDSLQQKIKEAKSKADQGKAWYQAANFYHNRGHYEQALSAVEQCIAFSIQSGQKKQLGDAYELKGVVFDYQGKMADAIEYYLKGLNIMEKLGNKRDVARALNNLGSVYYYMQSFPKAEDYFTKALAIFEKLDEPMAQAGAYTNLGSVKQQIGSDMDSVLHRRERKDKQYEALALHKKAKVLYESLGDEASLATSINNLGVVYSDLKMFDSSLIAHRRALQIETRIQDRHGISLSYSNLARLYLDLNKPDSALTFGKKALAMNRDLQSREGLRDDFQTLSDIYKKLGNFKLALENYVLYQACRDTLVNQESREKIASYFVQFEFQKQQYTDSLRHVEAMKHEELQKALSDKELQRQKNIQYSGIVIFVMVVLGSFFLIGRVHLPIIWIEGFIFFSAILVFEFLFLFLDPYVEAMSGGMPIYKFATNMVTAVAVFYAHSYFENLMKVKLIPKGPEPEVQAG